MIVVATLFWKLQTVEDLVIFFFIISSLFDVEK